MAFVLSETKWEARVGSIGGTVIAVARQRFPGVPIDDSVRGSKGMSKLAPVDNKFVLLSFHVSVSPLLPEHSTSNSSRERERKREREREGSVLIYTLLFPALVYNYAIFSQTRPYFFVPGDAPRSKSARHGGVVKSTRLVEPEKGGAARNESIVPCQGDDPLGVPWDLTLLVSSRYPPFLPLCSFIPPLPLPCPFFFYVFFFSPSNTPSCLFIRFLDRWVASGHTRAS